MYLNTVFKYKVFKYCPSLSVSIYKRWRVSQTKILSIEGHTDSVIEVSVSISGGGSHKQRY